MIPDAHFLTPEMFASLVNNGLGGLAVLMLWQVNARLARIMSIISDHEVRISKLENGRLIQRSLMADV